MPDNRSNYYDPEKTRTPWLRIAFIIIGIIIVILVIFLLLKSFNKGPDLYTDLMNSIKKYSESNESILPSSIGECVNITLKDLKDNNSLSNTKYYETCNNDETYVRICKLDENDYQYTPILSCDSIKTEFGDYESGTINDLTKNNSYVEFKFLAEQLKPGIKSYYPNNSLDANKVSEYYNASPAEEYVYKDNAEIAYKWYREKQVKDYYNDGEYVSVEPSGFPNKEEEKTNNYASLSEPPQAEYRTIKQATIYANLTVARPYKYDCQDTNIPGKVTSNTVCEARNSDTFKKTIKIHYTCDGTTEVAAETICSGKTNWSLNSCSDSNQTKTGTTQEGYNYTRNVSSGYTCISTSGYSVSDKVWKWYKDTKVNAYYPSDKSLEEEITYYTNTPVAGSSKDENTKTVAYKYYKLIPSDNGEATWISLTDQSLSEEELISKFKELGYEVNSLKDINENNEIRYQIEISYRDRK